MQHAALRYLNSRRMLLLQSLDLGFELRLQFLLIVHNCFDLLCILCLKRLFLLTNDFSYFLLVPDIGLLLSFLNRNLSVISLSVECCLKSLRIVLVFVFQPLRFALKGKRSKVSTHYFSLISPYFSRIAPDIVPDPG